MSTFVDWWQIKNVPGYITTGFTYGGTNPTTPIFNDAPLLFDQSLGVQISPGLWSIQPASLFTSGVITNFGGQQLVGPFFIQGGGITPLPPTFGMGPWNITLQDGQLAWYSSAEGAITEPSAFIEWDFLPESIFHINSGYALYIDGGSIVRGDMHFQHAGTGAILRFQGSAVVADDLGIVLESPYTTLFSGAGISAYLGVDAFGNTQSFGINGVMPTYTCLGNVGLYGFLTTGETISGGIITAPGPGTIPWGIITGTPTTFTGYGLTTPILPGDAAGGDLSGTYPNPGVAAIQGFPFAISSPATNDVLTWNGTDWINQAGGGGGLAIGDHILFANAYEVLFADASGNLAQDPAFNWIPGTGFSLFVSPYQVLLVGTSCGEFNDATNVVNIGNVTYGVQSVSSGTGIAGYFSDVHGNTVTLADGTNHVLYTAGDSGNWAASTPPTDVWIALDRIAAALMLLGQVP